MQPKDFGSYIEKTANPPGDDVAPIKGGRPKADDLPEFLARDALELYLSFLRCSFPRWSKNQLNRELFGDASPGAKGPLNGIGLLEKRKSIPLLNVTDQLSMGMLSAESRRKGDGSYRLAGGLQILYHPYLRLLSPPTELKALHRLMVLVKHSISLGVFKITRDGAVRTHLGVAADIAALDCATRDAKTNPEVWRDSFLDFVALALGLLREAALVGDVGGVSLWKEWLELGVLRFEHWPVGALECRKKFDTCLRLHVAEIHADGLDLESTALDYMRHAVVSSNFPPEIRHKKQMPMTQSELAWVFLAITEGTAPDKYSIARALRLHRDPVLKDAAYVRWD